MCGRARLPNDYSEIRIELGLGDFAAAPNWRPSWNIAPTQDIFTVIRDDETGIRLARIMHWGLIPAWSREAKLKYATFNAKTETVDRAASFRGAWKGGRRCLVVTSGFYEWRANDKQPFLIACTPHLFTVMAGLWETWTSPAGEAIRSCTVITTSANDLVAPIHSRMPVILAEKDWPTWLGEVPSADAELKALLKPYPSDEMAAWPVDRRVGNVRNNAPSLCAIVQ